MHPQWSVERRQSNEIAAFYWQYIAHFIFGNNYAQMHNIGSSAISQSIMQACNVHYENRSMKSSTQLINNSMVGLAYIAYHLSPYTSYICCM